MLRLRTTRALIVDEAMMSDCIFMNAFLTVLQEIPLNTDLRRCADKVGLPQFGYRDVIFCGDIRQLPPASGIAPFWSSWAFRNLFEFFVLREDRRHERDPCMREMKDAVPILYEVPEGTSALAFSNKFSPRGTSALVFSNKFSSQGFRNRKGSRPNLQI